MDTEFWYKPPKHFGQLFAKLLRNYFTFPIAVHGTYQLYISTCRSRWSEYEIKFWGKEMAAVNRGLRYIGVRYIRFLLYSVHINFAVKAFSQIFTFQRWPLNLSSHNCVTVLELITRTTIIFWWLRQVNIQMPLYVAS